MYILPIQKNTPSGLCGMNQKIISYLVEFDSMKKEKSSTDVGSIHLLIKLNICFLKLTCNRVKNKNIENTHQKQLRAIKLVPKKIYYVTFFLRNICIFL